MTAKMPGSSAAAENLQEDNMPVSEEFVHQADAGPPVLRRYT